MVQVTNKNNMMIIVKGKRFATIWTNSNCYELFCKRLTEQNIPLTNKPQKSISKWLLLLTLILHMKCRKLHFIVVAIEQMTGM